MKRYYNRTILQQDKQYENKREESKKARGIFLITNHIKQRFPHLRENPALLKELAIYMTMIVCALQFDGQDKYS